MRSAVMGRVAVPPDRDTPGIEDLGEPTPNTYARPYARADALDV
jgi:hypothetical protein